MAKVAIIGFSFRFPSTNFSRFWVDLLNGRDLVTTVEPGRWATEAFQHPGKTHPGASYTFAAGSIGDVSKFDAEFFGISPREAAFMDPQQRLLLELSWEALENSGIRPSSLRGSSCGVFIGIASADYSYRLADDLAAIDSSVATGNTASIAANRISYFYDLHGPSMAIDTACSSALVAFHQACRSILTGESTQALAGGVSLHLHPYGFITFSKASMLSRRGRCSVFDASGDGYVRSEGGGLFFLKDFDMAMADGDRILAVVADSAINTDGRKSGLTVPNPLAQASLLTGAYAKADIDPAAIDYIEAHGTGTAVGDPIETRALGEALGRLRPKGSPLLIGSVKSNLGHLEAASGVAGLVKALYCIKHRMVPATIGLETPNPKILFDEWNIEVVTQNRPLRESGKLVVGVNSFGFGGANAHVILESLEETEISPAKSTNGLTLPVILSAKSDAGLRSAAGELLAFLQDQPGHTLSDIAYQLAFRREGFDHRAVVFGSTVKAIAKSLQEYVGEDSETSTVETGIKLDAPSGPAFIYSGNGSQWFGMGKHLLKDPSFKQTIRKIDAIFRKYAHYSLEEELAGNNGEGRYEYTEIAQPAIFAVQVGITRMLRNLGVNPVAVAGHSVGEVAAAWACGALSLESAVKVIHQRSTLQGMTKGNGQMTAVGLGEQSIGNFLAAVGMSQILHLAGINSSRGVTLSGAPDDLARMEAALAERDIFFKRLELDYAFHSPSMDVAEAGIMDALSDLEPHESAIPFYSTVTGGLLDGRELGAEYWWHNIRQTVQFEASINSVLKAGLNVFVEIGPHPVLRAYIADCLKEAEITGRIIPTVLRGDDDPQRVWRAASQVVISGASIDWQSLFPSKGRFIQLPNYPWQRETHWHNVTPESLGLLYRYKQHPLLGYPLQQHELTWENQIDTQTHPMLADHVVGEAIVFPGSGFAELALAAAQAWRPGEYAEIEELEIRSPLLLNGEHAKMLRLMIDNKDGSFSIKAREHLGSEPWVLHASGRILREPSNILSKRESPTLPSNAVELSQKTLSVGRQPFAAIGPAPAAGRHGDADLPLNSTALTLPSRPPDFSHHSHEAMTKALGLGYGPGFQAIDLGWVENDKALAIFRTPQALAEEMEHYLLHPAFLDCAFQLIIQILNDERAGYDGIVFVPTKLGRIAIRAGKTRPHFASATLLRRAPHSLLADFTLFDETGLPLAFVKEVRFRSLHLHKNVSDQLRYLHYHCIPKPRPLAAEAPPSLGFEQLCHSMKEVVRRCVLKGTHRRYSEEIDPLLDGLCSRFTLEALIASTDGVAGSLSEKIIAAQKTNSRGTPFASHLLHMLQEDGLIEADAEGWKALPILENQATAQDIWNSLVEDYPDYFQIIHAVGCVGIHLRSLLDGVLKLEQACPKEASLAVLGRRVFGASGKNRLGQALAELTRKAQNSLPEGQRLEIIEICEGLPSYAFDVCSCLDFDRCDFLFASPSPASIEQAQNLKEKFPAVGIHSINGAELKESSLFSGTKRYHLAIVTMDFSNSLDALKSLEFVGAHLVPGGSLLVLGQHPTRWIDFVFGGQPGWWAESSAGSWISQQQTVRYWQRQIELLGFSDISVLEFSPDTASGPYVLLANRPNLRNALPLPTRGAPRNWLIFTDEQGYSSILTEHLKKQLMEVGDRTILAAAGNQEHIVQVLRHTLAVYGPLAGIVHLAGLNAESPTGEPLAPFQNQLIRCATSAAIIQACETALIQANLWIVTTGALSDMLPNRQPSGGRASTRSFADSALWGFGRTLMNEITNNAVYLVDLEDPTPVEILASALIRELDEPNDEQEIIITGLGGRFVPRLRLNSLPGSPVVQQQQDNTSVMRLVFHMPGQLRNLRWEEHPHAPPSEDELEVEVRATGLNFRDVMYALGLLSDEAVENGFAGPTLGMEFAGTILHAGANTSGFAAGDRVVGFGPSSFSNRVVTKPGAISHIPPGISFEAATTIPSAFFTAYYALHQLARLGEGEKVLIHGAAGGVGIAAIQVAKWRGAEIFATAGSNEKRDFLRLLGIEHILDSRSLAFADEILALTDGEGVDVVLNSLAGEAINRNLRVLKPFGRFLELGKRDFYENTKIGLRPLRNNISYFGIDADQLMVERPDLTRKLFSEVMALFSEGMFHPLPYHAFEAENIVNAFRYMQQSKQIGKIIVTYRNGIPAAHPTVKPPSRNLDFRADGSYLVTGGLSGFGLKTAQWLADKGARRLILISRSGPASDEAKEAIAELEQRGVRVMATACDVADKEAISTLLNEAAHRHPPLKGIFHAAAVFDDSLIRNMDMEQIRRVFAPKILGAQNLHDLSLDMDLDFFVLYSSATTLFGNPGQGNYIAANAWLEALARHRRALGLPAASVLWGAIDDAGFLARNEKIKDAMQNRMGGSAINSSLALAALEGMLMFNRSGEGVLEFDWKALNRFLPSAGSPKFSELTLHAGELDPDEDHSQDLQRLLAELSGDELRAALSDMLKQEVGEILRISPEKIDASRSVYDMGLDSLMGVELVVALESRFGIRLPVMALSENPTIDKLAGRIISLLRGNEEQAETSAESSVLSQVRRVVSQHAAEVSADEVARFADDIESGSSHSEHRLIH